MRLIDADALNDSMYHEAFETDSELQKWDSGCWIRYKMFENHLDMAPTADAVPVVRCGKWVEAKSGVMSVWPSGQVMCSVCGQRMPNQWKKMPPYCYGCGAKMEEQNVKRD